MRVKPAITPEAAIDTAIKSVALGSVAVAPPRAELVIYPIVKTERLPSAAGKGEEELNALDLNEVVEAHELAYHVRTRMRTCARALKRTHAHSKARALTRWPDYCAWAGSLPWHRVTCLAFWCACANAIPRWNCRCMRLTPKPCCK